MSSRVPSPEVVPDATGPVTEVPAMRAATIPTPPVSPATPAPSPAADRPREIGGRQGPEPTRFGDWEKGGRCIDF